jgi:hypothetical protein
MRTLWNLVMIVAYATFLRLTQKRQRAEGRVRARDWAMLAAWTEPLLLYLGE